MWNQLRFGVRCALVWGCRECRGRPPQRYPASHPRRVRHGFHAIADGRMGGPWDAVYRPTSSVAIRCTSSIMISPSSKGNVVTFCGSKVA